MSLRRQSVVAAVAGLLVAVAIIGGLSYMQPSWSSPPNQVQSGSPGSLSVAVTDPPNAPPGVTAAYLSYSDVQVHISNAGNGSGWYMVASYGTLQLFNLVNISQTIGTVKVPSGNYNMVKFNVTSATITFNGKNYTAFVPSGEFKVSLTSDVSVNSTTASGILLDLTPTITNIGSASLPEFIISPAVHAFAFPNGQVRANETKVGDRVSLGNMPWFGEDQHGNQSAGAVKVTAVSLSASSLAITITNVSNESVTLRTLLLGPNVTEYGDSGYSRMVFIIGHNGTLSPLSVLATAASNSNRGSGDNTTSDSNSTNYVPDSSGDSNSSETVPIGYTLSANASVTFTYNGPISFSAFPDCSSDQHVCASPVAQTPSGVVSGQQYVIAVVGEGMVVSASVVAS